MKRQRKHVSNEEPRAQKWLRLARAALAGKEDFDNWIVQGPGPVLPGGIRAYLCLLDNHLRSAAKAVVEAEGKDDERNHLFAVSKAGFESAIKGVFWCEEWR